MTKVIWLFENETKEHVKEFSTFLEAMKFQGGLLKKYKERLIYLKYA